MDKEDVNIYSVEYDSAIEKYEINAICSNMDGPSDSQTKWSKSEKDKISPDITYMWNVRYDL